jgi:uncharacterized membrane protein YsdA (DUF1294 family)/cold shock CspA family protein
MRHQGRITKWKDDQGFGFITPKGGADEVFVHINAFSNRQRRPKGAENVTYELTSDAKGRIRAAGVAFLDDGHIGPTRKRRKTFIFPALFLIFLAATVFTGRLPFPILGLYVAASAITFFVYARDKAAAQANLRRTSEATLHALSLIGGWPGAFIAQELLRHKSQKQSFRIVFWITVVLNCFGLVWLLSPSGSDVLRSIVGPF